MTVPFPTGTDGLPVDMNRADQTYGVTSYGPPSVASLVLPLISISEAERSTVARLTSRIDSKRFHLELRDAYYRGTVRIQDLGISIPPQMRNLHTAIGWPRVAVEALDRRLNVDGFRYPDSNDVDESLQEIWLANDMDAEHTLGNLDALVFGAGYASVGSPESGPNVIDTPPLITVESPLDIAVEWDARTRQMTAALRVFDFEGSKQATLYLPMQTVSLVMSAGGWTVTDRDVHNIGRVLIERIANRARSYDRDGGSEITPELMSLTDTGCRTLLGLTVAGEFYSAPQRYMLGAQESAFQNADGTPKSAWETYIGRIVALEANEDGVLPQVGTFQAYDPSVFTKVLDNLAQRVSAITGVPQHALGFNTTNPTSADAIRSSEMELTRRADNKTVMFGKSWRNVMKLALLVRDGQLPADAEKIQTVWSSTATPTIASTSDAIFKQVTMGYLPATSDVTGEKLGYSAMERARIEADRKTDAGLSYLSEVAHLIETRDVRAGNTLARTGATPTPTAAPVTDVQPAT